MSTVMSDEVFVIGGRVYDIGVSCIDGDPRTVVVTVTLDGRFEWSLMVPGWRRLSGGVRGGPEVLGEAVPGGRAGALALARPV